MTKVAFYARYSSDLQTDKSIEDQLRLCRVRAEAEGWHVANTYFDKALSGANMLRSGVQQLLADVRERKFDVVLAESLDRLSRDQEDIAHIYKRIRHAEMRLVTLAEGEISELHIGLKGTMGALYLKDLAQKTHRGLQGVALAGKSAGGKAFGYDTVRKLDANGEPIRGDRVINEAEAEIVRRIFRDYVSGKSPKRIAFELNKEGTGGPRGESWGQSTINGNRRRGTGILNNELYIGRLVWNRQRFVKNPDTGKREARPNPESEWVIVDVPELRIVDQGLWDRTKEHQKGQEHDKSGFWKNQRPRGLLSYLVRCGVCGGGCSKVSANHIGCSTARNKGTCENRLTIKLDKLEEMVIGSLRTRLMNPELCRAFCEEYTAHVNRVRMERNAARGAYRGEFDRNKREIGKLLDAIVGGVHPSQVKDRINFLSARQEELETLLNTTEEAPVLIHPNMAHRYHVEVQNLVGSLNDPAHRAESALSIRKLVDKIVLSPNEDWSALVVDLHGDLAGILRIADRKRTGIVVQPSAFVDEKTNTELQQVKLVAGGGFEPPTFRL